MKIWLQKISRAEQRYQQLGPLPALELLIATGPGIARLNGCLGGAQRVSDLLQLGELLQENWQTQGRPSPARLGLWLAQKRCSAEGSNSSQQRLVAAGEMVCISTLHASKGLEFDAVFISGLEEGLFPHENSMNDYDGLEEERRLMYVAITRARKRLYLSCSQTRMLHGQTRYNLRSRFLDELPERCLKWLSPKQAAPFGQGSGAGGFGSYGGAGRPAWGSSGLGEPPAQASPQALATAPASPRSSHGLRGGRGVLAGRPGCRRTAQTLCQGRARRGFRLAGPAVRAPAG